jgi:hypothetical protein
VGYVCHLLFTAICAVNVLHVDRNQGAGVPYAGTKPARMDRLSSMRSRCDQERNIMSFRSFKAGRLGASAACIAVSAFIFPALAMAQQAAPETAATDQGIVVTGIRASLDASASLKRRSPVIVESISAEDIGKLPDVSIADSLARLPGVTAQRLEGRDQRLSIRGLGPDLAPRCSTAANRSPWVTTAAWNMTSIRPNSSRMSWCTSPPTPG